MNLFVRQDRPCGRITPCPALTRGLAQGDQSMSSKVAVVTGAAQGVGFETSQLFATLGYHVVMTDVQPLDGPVPLRARRRSVR